MHYPESPKVISVSRATSKIHRCTDCLSAYATTELPFIHEYLCKFVGTSKICDCNGDKMSKTKRSFHTCSMKLKGVLVNNEKYGTLSLN